MRLSGQPESEPLVRTDGLDLLLKSRQPASDKMQVLEADPFSLHSRRFDHFNSSVVLTTTHSDFMEALSSNDSLSELLQLSGWIGTRRDDEQNWLKRSGFLLVDVPQRKWSWLHLLTECFVHKQLHGRFKAVRSQYLDENGPLERSDASNDLLREGLLRSGVLDERNPHLVRVKSSLLQQVREGSTEVLECLKPVFRDPVRNLELVGANQLPSEELPLVLGEERREDALHKLKAVGESISLEQRSADLREAQLDESIL